MEKMDAKDGSDSDTDASGSILGEDSEGEGKPQSFKRTRKAALDVLEGKEVDGHTASTGLFALPFMRKAMERRKQESMAAAEKLLAEINGTEGEQEKNDEPTGRLTFAGKEPKASAQVVDSESEDELILDPEATEAYAVPAPKVGRTESESKETTLAKVNPGQAKSALAAVEKGDRSKQKEKENGLPGFDNVGHGSVASRKYLFESNVEEQEDLVSRKSSRGKKANKEMGAKASPADITESAAARNQGSEESKNSGVGQYVLIAPQSNSNQNGSDSELEEISDDDKILEAGPTAPAGNGEQVKPDAAHRRKANGFLMKPEAPKAQAKSQEDLIEMAFAGDDVGVDFAAEKAKEVEKDLGPELEVNVLPGWGRWKHQQREPQWMVDARAKDKTKREKARAARKDSSMEHVIINEKTPPASAKYMVTDVPREFKGEASYELSMRQPIGKEFNTTESFQDFTRPSVITRAGVMIDPLRYSKSMKEQAVDTYAKYQPTDVKVSKIVGGTVDSFVKFPQAEVNLKKRQEEKARKQTQKNHAKKK